jgi:hypothetical protein
MAMQQKGHELDRAQVGPMKQATSQSGEVAELNIEALEDRIAPLWNRRWI